MKRHWILLIFLLSIVSEGCGIPPAETRQIPEPSPSVPQVAPTEVLPKDPLQFEHTPEATEMPSNVPVEKFIQLTKEDLASRLNIDAGQVTLVRSAEMLWLNEALGCPRPGVFYTEGRVPGFQIWLDVQGVEYVYNTDFNGALVLCPELNPHVPNTDKGPTPGVPIR